MQPEKREPDRRRFGYPHLHAQARQSLRDAAAVNTTRWSLYQRLCETGLPKAHWMDAACVGESGANVQIPPALSPLLIRATRHGSRQMCRMDRYGFPRTRAKGTRHVHVSGQGIWCALPGVSMFPLPVEHCRGLAGDIASFFTVPIGYAYSLNRKEAAIPLHCDPEGTPGQ